MAKTIGEDLKQTIGKIRSKPPTEKYEQNYDLIFRNEEASRICNLCHNYMTKVSKDTWKCLNCGNTEMEEICLQDFK